MSNAHTTTAPDLTSARAVAVEVATLTGDADFAAKMGALFDAFCRKNSDAIKASPEQAVAAFRVYCHSAEAAGVFA